MPILLRAEIWQGRSPSSLLLPLMSRCRSGYSCDLHSVSQEEESTEATAADETASYTAAATANSVCDKRPEGECAVGQGGLKAVGRGTSVLR